MNENLPVATMFLMLFTSRDKGSLLVTSDERWVRRAEKSVNITEELDNVSRLWDVGYLRLLDFSSSSLGFCGTISRLGSCCKVPSIN